MDELVNRKGVTGGDLVKAVTTLMPGDSIEHILDAVRTITLKRVLGAVKTQQFSTVIHLMEHLKTAGLTVEDVRTLLAWVEISSEISPRLRESVASLRKSELVDSVYEFVSELEVNSPPKRRGILCCFRQC
jgi:hypothetical protein